MVWIHSRPRIIIPEWRCLHINSKMVALPGNTRTTLDTRHTKSTPSEIMTFCEISGVGRSTKKDSQTHTVPLMHSLTRLTRLFRWLTQPRCVNEGLGGCGTEAKQAWWSESLINTNEADGPVLSSVDTCSEVDEVHLLSHTHLHDLQRKSTPHNWNNGWPIWCYEYKLHHNTLFQDAIITIISKSIVVKSFYIKLK